VVAVADPREALERVRSGERFSFALVDLQMPEMSGQEFLAHLRELDPDLAHRSAAVTGGPLAEAADRFPEEERPRLLPKPIDLDGLAALIDAAAEGERP
jgi:CheY-like chemotaxis protein